MRMATVFDVPSAVIGSFGIRLFMPGVAAGTVGMAIAAVPVVLFVVLHRTVLRWKLKRARFLGDYAVTGRRALLFGMTRGFTSLPHDSALRWQERSLLGNHGVGFRYPGMRGFRFGCLRRE
ncbi:unnamed protein product, partial [marine sediment metagenome]